MKRLLALGCMLFACHYLLARPSIKIGKSYKLSQVADLPDTDDFKDRFEASFLDLATLHEEFGIHKVLPLWITKEPFLVLAVDGLDEYVVLTEDEIDALLAAHRLDKEKMLQLPFYNRYGGKLVFLLFVVLGVFAFVHEKKKRDMLPRNL